MSREIGLAVTALALLVTLPGAKVATISAAPTTDLQLASQDTSVASGDPASVTEPLAEAPTSATSTLTYAPAVRAAAGGAGARQTNNAGGVTAGSSPLGNVLLTAYQRAASAVPASCHLEMTLLAAIGQVESGNLANYQLNTQNAVTPGVLGPVLDGSRFAEIRDTDRGIYDGDTAYDRAVGPMQFIPSTWLRFGVDLDRDGRRDPQDIDDAAGAAAAYLCHGGRDLGTTDGLRSGVYSYNHSQEYVDLVLAWKAKYDQDGFGSVTQPTTVDTGSSVVTTRTVTSGLLTELPGSTIRTIPSGSSGGTGGPRNDVPDQTNAYQEWLAQFLVNTDARPTKPVKPTNEGKPVTAKPTPTTGTSEPTDEPTEQPTDAATDEATDEAADEATDEASEEPTEDSTDAPTQEPTEDPTGDATDEPTADPETPSEEPTEDATATPTDTATETPSEEPTAEATEEPSELPTCDTLTEADLAALAALAAEEEPVPSDEATLSEAELVAISPEQAAALAEECG